MSPALLRLLSYALFFWLATFTFVGLDRAVGDGDESRHAIILKQMVQGGEYLRPKLDGAGYIVPSARTQTARSSITRAIPAAFERPLLPYWLAAPFASLIPGELGLRFSSALASFATLLVVFFAARRFWKRGDAAVVATLLLAGSPGFHVYSRTLMSEPQLVLGLTIAVACAVVMRQEPRFLIGAALGLGFAIACKSLVVAIPLLALSPWLLPAFVRADRRTRLLALASLVGLALPYYLLAFGLHGWSFVDAHFGSLGGRVTQHGGLGLRGGVLAYPRWILESEGLLTLAWLTLGSVGATVFGATRRRPELLLLGSFALSVIGAMSLISVRLPHYVLAAYPAAALGVAGLYAEAAAALRLERWRFAFLLGPVLAMIVLLEGRLHRGDVFLLQHSWGRDLGLLARRAMPAGRTLYAYEWNAASLEYYADRAVVRLTEHPKRFRLVAPYARAMFLVPPVPEPLGSELYVAGDAPTLARSRWLQVEQVLGHSAPMFLVRGRVVEPGTAVPLR